MMQRLCIAGIEIPWDQEFQPVMFAMYRHMRYNSTLHTHIYIYITIIIIIIVIIVIIIGIIKNIVMFLTLLSL